MQQTHAEHDQVLGARQRRRRCDHCRCAACPYVIAECLSLHPWLQPRHHGWAGIPVAGQRVCALAVLVLAGGPYWLQWAGALQSVGTLIAFAISRTMGLFGFTERGWEPVATSGGKRDRRGAHRGFGGDVCAEQPQQNHGRVGRFSPPGPWLVGDRLRFAAVHGLSRAWLSGPSP